jgi:hypothetical protein
VVSAPLVNHGQVMADQNGLTLLLNGWFKTGSGEFAASGGGELRLDVVPLNYNGSQRKLTGGTWRVTGNSTLRLMGCPVDSNAASIVLEGTGSRIVSDGAAADALAGLVRNSAGGHLTIRDGRNFTTVGAFPNGGEVTVGVASVFNVAGSYTQSSTGCFQTEIGGASEGAYGRMAVAGHAAVDGVLCVRLVNGFMPSTGDEFTVMTFASRSGEFSGFCPMAIGNGLYLTPEWRPGSLVLKVVGVPGVAVAPGPRHSDPLAFSAKPEPDGRARMTLSLPAPAEVEVSIYDLSGRRVGLVLSGAEPAGVRQAIWPPDGEGRRAASGLFFARARVLIDGEWWVRSAKLAIRR